MPTAVKPKWSSVNTLTITLASLANNASRQSTMVDNSSTRYDRIHVYAKVTVGTNPTANSTIAFWLIKGDNPASSSYRSDGAGATDASITWRNARLLDMILVPVNTSNAEYYRDFVIDNPGPEWGIIVTNNTGVSLNATAGNHFIKWIGENMEIQ